MVNVSTGLTSGVQRGMVRARISWRFLRWSVCARDLDTCVSLYHKPLHQCTIVALANTEGQRPRLMNISGPVTRVTHDSLHSICYGFSMCYGVSLRYGVYSCYAAIVL